jgi:hypothetical protein
MNVMELFQKFVDARSEPLTDNTVYVGPRTKTWNPFRINQFSHGEIEKDSPVRVVKTVEYQLPRYKGYSISGEFAPARVEVIYGGSIVPAGLDPTGRELYKWDIIKIINIDIISGNGEMYKESASIQETADLI